MKVWKQKLQKANGMLVELEKFYERMQYKC
jgi:hypothetical protein